MKIKSYLSPFISQIYFIQLLNKKSKKWTFFAILFFLLVSLDDYSVATLNIPPFQDLNVTNGTLKVEELTGGKGGSSGDMLHITNRSQSIKLRCRIHTGDESRCISKTDTRFYDTEIGDGSMFGKVATVRSNTSHTIKQAKAWWFESRVFGFLKENHLVQLDVAGERVIDYKKQKEKYMLERSNHGYIPTTLLIFSTLWFCVLQLTNKSLNIQKGK